MSNHPLPLVSDIWAVEAVAAATTFFNVLRVLTPAATLSGDRLKAESELHGYIGGGLSPIAARQMIELPVRMLENNNSSQSQSSAPASGQATGSVQERLERLREKVSDLSETLERVEQTAAESAGKIKE